MLGFASAAVAGLSFKEIIEDTDAAEKNLAQMGAVIKSTGGAAGMSSEELIELAESQSKLTTNSAETTESAEDLLLTFTKPKKSESRPFSVLSSIITALELLPCRNVPVSRKRMYV
jgi:hypothetical protein